MGTGIDRLKTGMFVFVYSLPKQKKSMFSCVLRSTGALSLHICRESFSIFQCLHIPEEKITNG
jgi:hypothetical protein